MLWWWRLQTRSDDAQVRVRAARKIGKSRNRSAVRVLGRLLGDPSATVRQAAAEALGKSDDPRAHNMLALALRAVEPMARAAAAAGLGLTGKPQAIAALRPRLEDVDLDVRQCAAKSLQALGWEPAEKRDQVLLAVALRQFDRAADVGSEATGILLDTLRAEDAGLRRRAADALVRLGDPSVVKQLVRMSRDAKVAQCAVEALRGLLQRNAAQAPEEGLRAAARLGTVSQLVSLDSLVGRKGAESATQALKKRVVDCTDVKNLARAELARRGCGMARAAS